MLRIKPFHIIAVFCLFSGLYYLPRLSVYDAVSKDQIRKDRFVVMERKPFWGITTPSMVITLALGFWVLYGNWSYFMAWRWMHVKLAMVAMLVAYHVVCWWHVVQLRDERSVRSQIFLRIFNDLSVLLLVSVVILIVVKPTL